MIEIDIPSIDPIQHQPKVFIGMTLRQIICVVPSIAVSAILFGLTYKLSDELAIILVLIVMFPAILIGWYKPYNMNFEDYAKLWFYNEFQSNPKRILKTDSMEEIKMLTIKEREIEEKKQREKELNEKKRKKAQKDVAKKSKKSGKEL